MTINDWLDDNYPALLGRQTSTVIRLDLLRIPAHMRARAEATLHDIESYRVVGSSRTGLFTLHPLLTEADHQLLRELAQ